MSIKGNTVGTSMPRSDWAQTDPKKADYIKNKPDLSGIEEALGAAEAAAKAADNASSAAGIAKNAADAAKETADAALPKAGGTMTGNIAMGGNKVTGLGDPSEDGDAASKKYVEDQVSAKHKVFNATLTVNDWAGAEAPYTQVIGIEGILASDVPHIAPVYSQYVWSMLEQDEAWALVRSAVATDGAITFTCLRGKPSVSIPIQIEVNR